MKKNLWIMLGFGEEVAFFFSAGLFWITNRVMSVLLLIAGVITAYLVGKLIVTQQVIQNSNV